MTNQEPLLVSSMRRNPTGKVRHYKEYAAHGGELKLSMGTTTRGFLAEFDEYIAAVKKEAIQKGWDMGYQDGYEDGIGHDD